MGSMIVDTKNFKMNGFAPSRIQAVTTDLWEPGADDRAFRVASFCTYQINGAGEAGTLQDGAIVLIRPGLTYKFDTAQNIEVM